MHEVLVNRLGGLSLPRKSVVRLTDRPDMTLDVYLGRKLTIQQQQLQKRSINEGARARQCFFFLLKIATVALHLALEPSNSKLFKIIVILHTCGKLNKNRPMNESAKAMALFF